MSLSLSSKQVLTTLLVIIIGLTCVSFVMNLIYLHVGQGPLIYYPWALLNVDEENNIPSLYSALALLASAMVLLGVFICYRRANRGSSVFVIFLAAIFVLLALDEALSLHERLNPITRQVVPQSDILFTAWVVPGVVFVSLIFFASIQFLRRLDRPTRTLVMISGAMFVGGAVGLEIMAWSHIRDGAPDTLYVSYTAVEELLEMSGIALFIFALLRHLETDFGGIQVSLGGPRKSRPGDPLPAGV